jgi:hypothetical protein
MRSSIPRRVTVAVLVLALLGACGGSGADDDGASTTTSLPSVPIASVDEIPFPRLDLIDRGRVSCATTGVLALADGSSRSIEECQGEYAFAESDVHIRHGWARDDSVELEALLAAGHFTSLTVDGVERPPTGYIDTWDDGSPFGGTYWVLEGMVGDHELTVRWYADGELFVTSANLVHFPGP